MDCVTCGQPIPEGELVMATYGDNPDMEPFPLLRSCYEENRIVQVSEWVTDPETGEPSLVYRDEERYREVSSG